MKVLFLSQIVPYPPKGGVLQRSYYVLREICKEYEVHLMAFIHPDILNTDEKIGEAKNHLLSLCKSCEFFPLKTKQGRVNFLWTIFISLFSVKPFSVIAFRSKKFRNHLNRLMKNHRFDIIHFDTIALAQYLLKGDRTPRTLTHHNVESVLMMRRSKVSKNPLGRFYLYLNGLKILRYEEKYLPRFHCNITCSEADRKLLLDIKPVLRVEVIPNGVDISYFSSFEGEEKEGLIIHVGALQSANLDGIQYFLSDIWPRIKNKRKGLHLKIVGGSVPESIAMIGRRDCDITVTGFVDDIRPYVREASVLIVPLRYGGGTKLKILDALAMGKAVVSTDVGIEGIDITTGENILVANSTEKFADSVLALVNSQYLREKIGRKGRKLVEKKYDWSLIGEQQRKLYRELTSRSN